MNKKIAILLSTYNGYEYLEQQVNSILKQSNTEWQLYIRDDGSTDGTVSLIRKLSHNPQITFFNDKEITNVGTVRSFMDLLENIDADYFMFSDQDDYWLPNKIQDTLEEMQSIEKGYPGKPVCVHTNLQVTDDKLNPYRLYNKMPSWSDFPRILFNNCATGCTMMINKKLKEMVKFSQLDYQKVFMHDWWLTLIAACFGKVAYLDEPTILYRQHGSNVLGSLDGSQAREMLQPINRIISPNYDFGEFVKALNIITEFNREYGSEVQGKNKEYLTKYAQLSENSSLVNNIKLLIQLPPKETSLKKTILYSMIMLRFARKIKKQNDCVNKHSILALGVQE